MAQNNDESGNQTQFKSWEKLKSMPIFGKSFGEIKSFYQNPLHYLYKNGKEQVIERATDAVTPYVANHLKTADEFAFGYLESLEKRYPILKEQPAVMKDSLTQTISDKVSSGRAAAEPYLSSAWWGASQTQNSIESPGAAQSPAPASYSLWGWFSGK